METRVRRFHRSSGPPCAAAAATPGMTRAARPSPGAPRLRPADGPFAVAAHGLGGAVDDVADDALRLGRVRAVEKLEEWDAGHEECDWNGHEVECDGGPEPPEETQRSRKVDLDVADLAGQPFLVTRRACCGAWHIHITALRHSLPCDVRDGEAGRRPPTRRPSAHRLNDRCR